MGIPLSSSVFATVTILSILASLSPIQCENSTVRPPESRIINGEDAAEGEFPHQAYLKIETPDGPGFCGGSILNANYILTAAHCLHKFDASKVSVGVGKRDTRDISEFYPAADLILHPCWGETNNERIGVTINDIALIKLAKPLPLDGRNIKAIQLDEKNFCENGLGTAIGWGRTNAKKGKEGKESAILKKAQFKIVTKWCQTLDRKMAKLVPESQICTNNIHSFICEGDSGGPLLLEEFSTKTIFLCGVLSISTHYGDDEHQCQGPNVFTRVYHYRKWIKSILSGTKSEEGCIGDVISRGSISYRPNHVISGICLTLIFLSFWGKKIF